MLQKPKTTKNHKIAMAKTMTKKLNSTKIAFVIAVAVLITLNFYTFIVAYPETYAVDSGINTSGTIVAKDFSAYYMGAWRLWHNPANIYVHGALGGGEPAISPYPEDYKYLPSFLLIVTPFLTLSYQQALLAFDIVQFLFLPLIAYMLYKILGTKPLVLIFIVFIIVLLLPFPTLNWGFSPSYFWQWGEGQAKVFLVFLLLLSFYFGNKGKTALSGVALAFGFFDPRFGLLALPLYIMYNHHNVKVATASLILALAASNLMLLYPGMATAFVNMAFAQAVTTPLYYYSLIPLFTLLTLIVVNFKEIVAAFDYKEILADFTGAQKKKQKLM
jgi:hypothetical protein